MTTFLAAFSIILNIIALLAIVILYLRQNRFLAAEKKQQQLMEEMENLFSAYLIEIKEENDRFIAGINRVPIQSDLFKKERDIHQDNEKASGEQDVPPDENDQETVSRGVYGRMHAAKTYQAAMSKSKASETELSEAEETVKDNMPENKETIMQQISYLKGEGLTVDEIAKKLNKGKTEIELFMKFHLKDE
jgi:hypothetical protein